MLRNTRHGNELALPASNAYQMEHGVGKKTLRISSMRVFTEGGVGEPSGDPV